MNWTRSTKCAAGECVEVAMNWTRSSECEGGSCLEVTFDSDESVAVRNSKIPGEVVWFTRDEWVAFVAGVKAGEFDEFHV